MIFTRWRAVAMPMWLLLPATVNCNTKPRFTLVHLTIFNRKCNLLFVCLDCFLFPFLAYWFPQCSFSVRKGVWSECCNIEEKKNSTITYTYRRDLHPQNICPFCKKVSYLFGRLKNWEFEKPQRWRCDDKKNWRESENIGYTYLEYSCLQPTC